MTPKEIAEKIVNELEGDDFELPEKYRTWFSSNLERVVTKLNLTVAPPKVEGSVQVLVAVSVEPSLSVNPSLIVGRDAIVADYANEDDRANMMEAISSDRDTHRCFAVIDVPPVAPVPVVEGTVTK